MASHPNAPATRPSPTPQPSQGSSACSPTKAWCPRCGRSTATRSPSGRVSAFPRSRARTLVRAVGAVEAGFAIATAARSGKRWPFVIAMAAMPTLAIGAAKSDRAILTKAFNPGSLGIAVAALAGVALATRNGRPSGRRPLRARTRPSTRGGGPPVTSIYRQQLGDDFDRLHPEDAVAIRVLIGRRDLPDRHRCHGRGVARAVVDLPVPPSGGRPAGSSSPPGVATSPSSSRNYTRTSTASAARPSPGHAPSSSGEGSGSSTRR